jgi:hypothetical protein
MKSLQDVLEEYKAGTLTLEQAKEWNQEVYNKISADAMSKAEKKYNTPELQSKLDKIAELEKDKELLSKESKTRVDLEKLIDRMKAEFESEKTASSQELERTKTLLEKKESAYINKTLKEISTRLLKEIGVSKPEYASDDLVRDGKIKMLKVKKDDGSEDYEIQTDFEYNDKVLNKRVKSNFKGTENNLDDIKKAFTMLVTDETDYNRIKELYPVTKDFQNGSGVKGQGFGKNVNYDVTDPYGFKGKFKK